VQGTRVAGQNGPKSRRIRPRQTSGFTLLCPTINSSPAVALHLSRRFRSKAIFQTRTSYAAFRYSRWQIRFPDTVCVSPLHTCALQFNELLSLMSEFLQPRQRNNTDWSCGQSGRIRSNVRELCVPRIGRLTRFLDSSAVPTALDIR